MLFHFCIPNKLMTFALVVLWSRLLRLDEGSTTHRQWQGLEITPSFQPIVFSVQFMYVQVKYQFGHLRAFSCTSSKVPVIVFTFQSGFLPSSLSKEALGKKNTLPTLPGVTLASCVALVGSHSPTLWYNSPDNKITKDPGSYLVSVFYENSGIWGGIVVAHCNLTSKSGKYSSPPVYCPTLNMAVGPSSNPSIWVPTGNFHTIALPSHGPGSTSVHTPALKAAWYRTK